MPSERIWIFSFSLSILSPFHLQMPWCVDISVLCRTTQKQPLPYSGSIYWESGHHRCHHNLATTWLNVTCLLQASVLFLENEFAMTLIWLSLILWNITGNNCQQMCYSRPGFCRLRTFRLFLRFEVLSSSDIDLMGEKYEAKRATQNAK